ncbi:MAG: 50S ribosomal protein L31e [Euryarchaeota archaeon]|nr:50S ribosomal protein L31e [Euryarchaeota archaeon]MDE1836992.1 50S ribosomal protein L31e [Euryarchaeota archaeon]MDE1881565.1 50S ribosomal protein L31e [Euryarchaeota archaeon]MDE2046368.1 50S ribosomal protein L31e [Thermoplasmata archaeon]
MAKEEKTRIEELEREFIVPLRASQHAPPRRERASHSVLTIKRFMIRHMKGEMKDIWIDPRLNEFLWERSISHVPSKVRVKAIRFEDGLVEVDLAEDEG